MDNLEQIRIMLNMTFPTEISYLITTMINYNHKPNKDCVCKCTINVSKFISRYILNLVRMKKLRQNRFFLESIDKVILNPDKSYLLNDFKNTDDIIESIEHWGRCSCCSYHSNLSNIGLRKILN